MRKNPPGGGGSSVSSTPARETLWSAIQAQTSATATSVATISRAKPRSGSDTGRLGHGLARTTGSGPGASGTVARPDWSALPDVLRDRRC